MASKLTQHARDNRLGQTAPEGILWSKLKSRQLGGRKWRRQHPIEPFIADFACVEVRMIVELDGGQHAEAVRYDERRTRLLEASGWRVLRFWNSDVLKNLNGVLQVIAEEADDRARMLAPTAPHSPTASGGGSPSLPQAGETR